MHTRAAGGAPLALVIPDDREANLGARANRVVVHDPMSDVVVSIGLHHRARGAETAPPPRRTRWDERSIRAELSLFVAGRDVWPTYDEFVAAGHKRLRDAIGRYRGPQWWATEVGLPGGDRGRGGVRRGRMTRSETPSPRFSATGIPGRLVASFRRLVTVAFTQPSAHTEGRSAGRESWACTEAILSGGRHRRPCRCDLHPRLSGPYGARSGSFGS
jgi:hypothetical protein